jgi:hypothetical protein
MDTQALHQDHAAHYRICMQGRFEDCWLEMLSGVWVFEHHQPSGGITMCP